MSRRGWWITVLILWIAVLVSSIYLVRIRHQARLQFIELQKIVKQRDSLATEWSQLQIEQSALSSHARIDRLARQKLKLKQPSKNDVVIIGGKKANKKNQK